MSPEIRAKLNLFVSSPGVEAVVFKMKIGEHAFQSPRLHVYCVKSWTQDY